jgi:hypothetical protein
MPKTLLRCAIGGSARLPRRQTAGEERNKVQKNAQSETYVPQDSPSGEVIRRWLVAFGEIFRREINSTLVGLWCSLLSRLDPGLLDRACAEVARTSKFFPVPGDVLALVKQGNKSAFPLLAAEQWEHALKYVQEYWEESKGLSRAAPELSSDVQFALREAGGFAWVSHVCEWEELRHELNWARKRFIDGFTTFHQAQEHQDFISDTKSHQLLRDVGQKRLALLDSGPSDRMLRGADILKERGG